VLDLAELRLDAAHLAYLSACSTARGSLRLLDESIHLISAFQLAGFSHVVGTLWPIADDIAARVADETYREISAHPDQVAPALHWAVRRVRDAYPRNPAYGRHTFTSAPDARGGDRVRESGRATTSPCRTG
jgi:CHAT domain-containing protein